MLHIIDYGMGNLRSVQKAFESLGVEAIITTRPSDLDSAERIVLPGVGAFRDAIAELKRLDFVPAIRHAVDSGKPVLGICLGLQLLFDVSEEDGEHTGLGIIPGRVVRFVARPGLKVPHMGWNSLTMHQNHPLFRDISSNSHVYFVHSYHVVPDEPSVIAASCDHGGAFVAAIARGNLVATQFHPEKSQKIGLQLLKNFAQMSVSPCPIQV